MAERSDIEISDQVERRILILRGRRVLLDFDLAELYQVETKALNQAVTRNVDRFPEDFMVRLTSLKFADWRSHFVTSNPKAKMGLRRPPRAFTEQGVAMLSSVLRSKRAVRVNIEIMRAFVRLRALLSSHEECHDSIDNADVPESSLLERCPQRTTAWEVSQPLKEPG